MQQVQHWHVYPAMTVLKVLYGDYFQLFIQAIVGVQNNHADSVSSICLQNSIAYIYCTLWNGIRVIIHHSLHKLHVSYFIRFTTFTLQSPIHKLHHSIHKVSYSLYKVLYPIYNIQNSLYKVQSINFTS